MDPTQPFPLRLLSYNIHKGIGGLDRRYRLERIVGVVAPRSPDLVLLQEVDEGVPRSRRERQVDALGELLGFAHRAYFPNVSLREGRYGNALLSRFAIRHAENLDLSVRFKKPRGALHARLAIEHGGRERGLWVFNIHLGLAEIERRVQLRRLLAWTILEKLDSSTACLVAGDFNDTWGRLGRAVLEPAGFSTYTRRLRTFPAWAPYLDLDRCFVRGPIDLVRAIAPRYKPAKRASDHLPLVVDLMLR